MGRPKVSVSDLQGERLNIVLEEQGLQKNKLANLVGVTPASISRYVHCKDRLNEDVAETISNKFGYNKEWLLCKDNRKTKYEVRLSEIEEKDLSYVSCTMLLMDAIEMAGMNFEVKQSEAVALPADQWRKLSIYKQLAMSEIILKENGKQCVFSVDDITRLQKHLTHYIKMLVEETFEEGDSEDGER